MTYAGLIRKAINGTVKYNSAGYGVGDRDFDSHGMEWLDEDNDVSFVESECVRKKKFSLQLYQLGLSSPRNV